MKLDLSYSYIFKKSTFFLQNVKVTENLKISNIPCKNKSIELEPKRKVYSTKVMKDRVPDFRFEEIAVIDDEKDET